LEATLKKRRMNDMGSHFLNTICLTRNQINYKRKKKIGIRVLEEKKKKKRKGVELEAQTIKQSQAIWQWPP